MKRLNITLPEALKEKLTRIKKEKMNKLLAEGYKATKEEDKKINKEWENVTLHRASPVASA